MSFIVSVAPGQFSKNCSGGYVKKHDGTVHIVKDPLLADHYSTKDDAEAGKIGHHPDMGGSGFKGRIIPIKHR